MTATPPRITSVLKGLSVAPAMTPLRLQPTAPHVLHDAQAPAEFTKAAPTRLSMTEGELRAQLEAARQHGMTQAAEAAQAAARVAIDTEVARQLERVAKEQAERWRQLATALAAQMVQVREQFESDVTQAVFVAACRLVGETAFSQAHVTQKVLQVLNEAGAPPMVKVLLHPDDLATATEAQRLAQDEWPAGISFAPDGSIALGGCLIETSDQRFDARLEVQIELLHERLGLTRAQRGEAHG